MLSVIYPKSFHCLWNFCCVLTGRMIFLKWKMVLRIFASLVSHLWQPSVQLVVVVKFPKGLSIIVLKNRQQCSICQIWAKTVRSCLFSKFWDWRLQNLKCLIYYFCNLLWNIFLKKKWYTVPWTVLDSWDLRFWWMIYCKIAYKLK